MEIKWEGAGAKVRVGKGYADIGLDEVKGFVNISFLDGNAKIHGVVGAKSAA